MSVELPRTGLRGTSSRCSLIQPTSRIAPSSLAASRGGYSRRIGREKKPRDPAKATVLSSERRVNVHQYALLRRHAPTQR